MKKLIALVVAASATGVLVRAAMAADVKIVPQAPSLSPSPWDIALGLAFVSDYNFRGITQSNHKPSVWAYFEPRYNITKDLQLYAGIGGESIAFPNGAAAEIDLSAGIRPTLGPVALDLGVWYYWYPGGECFHNLGAFGADCAANGALPINANTVKANLNFLEIFAKSTFTLNEGVAFGVAMYYSPSVVNSGANGTYVSGNLKFTAPKTLLPDGFNAYWSAEAGYWLLGTTDAFYCSQNAAGTACGGSFPNAIPYSNYANWNFGFGITKSVITVDFRYYDSDLRRGDCNAVTSDHTARFTRDFTPTNSSGFGSNWCGQAFIIAGKVDLTATANLK
jgi:uncharacterized protein (TIGR02001 family)